jgi:hypothetical protein
MKLLILLLILCSGFAQGASVLSAKLDYYRENILVEVAYFGGCKEHQFVLKMDPYCMSSYPAQCSARLVDTTEIEVEMCDEVVNTTAVFNIAEYGLDDIYYNGASLTIHGDRSLTGEVTSATVDLPWVRLP